MMTNRNTTSRSNVVLPSWNSYRQPPPAGTSIASSTTASSPPAPPPAPPPALPPGPLPAPSSAQPIRNNENAVNIENFCSELIKNPGKPRETRQVNAEPIVNIDNLFPQCVKNPGRPRETKRETTKNVGEIGNALSEKAFWKPFFAAIYRDFVRNASKTRGDQRETTKRPKKSNGFPSPALGCIIIHLVREGGMGEGKGERDGWGGLGL